VDKNQNSGLLEQVVHTEMTVLQKLKQNLAVSLNAT
jgi:hypothetical protein